MSALEPFYNTFISLGNSKQSFVRLIESIQSVIPDLPKPILIQHGHTPCLSKQMDTKDFISMDTFVNCIQRAKIIILHAGAGSVLHAIREKKWPIIMPREGRLKEHVNNHQIDFAKALHELGKAIMVTNSIEMKEAIHKVEENHFSPQPNDHFSAILKKISGVL